MSSASDHTLDPGSTWSLDQLEPSRGERPSILQTILEQIPPDGPGKGVRIERKGYVPTPPPNVVTATIPKALRRLTREASHEHAAAFYEWRPVPLRDRRAGEWLPR